MQRGRGAGHRGRGGRGGRGGGGGGRIAPSLPGALRDQLGMQPPHKARRRFDDDQETARPQRPNFKHPNGFKQKQEEPKVVSRPVSAVKVTEKTKEVEMQPEEEVRVASKMYHSKDGEDAGTPFSGTSRKRKVDPKAMTPLARLLAGQQGASSGSVELDGEEELKSSSSKKRKSNSEENNSSKLTKKEKTFDPSIMSRFTDLSVPGSSVKTKAELDEEQEIKWLEYKLGMGKFGKGKAKKSKVDEDGIDWEEDGLDDLLDFADNIAPGGYGTESEEDLEDEEMDFSDMEELSGDDDQDMSEEEAMDEDEGLEEYYTEEDEKDRDHELDARLAAAKQQAEANEATDESALMARGTTPTEPVTTTSGGRYVPPHLRQVKADASAPVKKTEAQIKLDRKLQGLLNKTSEANIESIVNEIESLYRDNSRNDVTTSLTNLIIGTIADRSGLIDSFVILYAALTAALFKVIGMEFGAHLVQSLVTRYTDLVPKQSSIISEPGIEVGKKPLNLLTLISELYNFQVVGCNLLYDLIRGFIDSMTPGGDGDPAAEYPVEALLKVMRCSGSQLRSDDPTSLKDIVQLVQTKTAGHESQLTVRAKFMVETLVNISQNKIRAVPGGDVAAVASGKMKKFLGGLNKKRHVMAHEPLRVTLADLQNADTRGRWWMTGAGWRGDPLREHEAKKAAAAAATAKSRKMRTTTESDDEELDLLGQNDNEELLKMARKQGMNTEVRRAIFVTMMTSDDYIHACERLNTLKYTEVQQREFVRVALHCSGMEQEYNPYYTLILTHLCESSYSHRFSLQYAYWDFLRGDLGEAEIGGESHSGGGGGGRSAFADGDDDSEQGKEKKGRKVRNLALTLAWIIGKGAADLSIFKPVEFSGLGKPARQFFTLFFSHLFLAVGCKNPLFKLPAGASRTKTDSGLTKTARENLETILAKSNTVDTLGQGIAYFLATTRLNVFKTADGEDKLKREIKGLMFGAKWKWTDREMKIIREGVEIARKVLGDAV